MVDIVTKLGLKTDIETRSNLVNSVVIRCIDELISTVVSVIVSSWRKRTLPICPVIVPCGWLLTIWCVVIIVFRRRLWFDVFI